MSERKPKVFVTQVPSRRDAASGLWVPTVNVGPAEQFGEVVTLLPPGSQFYAAAETTRLIKQRLHDLDYQSGDYLLPMGNPVIMAVASAVAARRSNGCLNVLVWDKHSSSYVPYELENLT
jgi:hypothetical protein